MCVRRGCQDPARPVSALRFTCHPPCACAVQQSGWVYTLLLAYSTIGTIYGDLGTSPLYTVGAVFGRWEEPDETDFLGVASCIFWTITLVPLLEYVFIILYADDLGEGEGPCYVPPALPLPQPFCLSPSGWP